MSTLIANPHTTEYYICLPLTEKVARLPVLINQRPWDRETLLGDNGNLKQFCTPSLLQLKESAGLIETKDFIV